MIFRTVRLKNFGVFEGEHEFDLIPEPTNNFNRPVILFNGKNGVGKTTLVEAIRLCLHGQFVIGDRVGRGEFETYLRGRIHRSPVSGKQCAEAAVELEFDYVRVGQKSHYRICRSWKTEKDNVVRDLELWENHKKLDLLSTEQREEILREIVPVGLVDLFFFDGERIRTLSSENASHQLLADTVKAMLGLNIVEQLEKDLDIYISRQQADFKKNGTESELETLIDEQSKLEESHNTVQNEIWQLHTNIGEVQETIDRCEREVAESGGWYAAQRDEGNANKNRLEQEIATKNRQAEDLCSELLPFAVAPDLLQAVQARLELEKQFRDSQTADKVLEKQLASLKKQMGSAKFWAETDVKKKSERTRIFEQVEQTLRQTVPQTDITAEDVILQVSDKEQAQLSQWIEQAITETPKKFWQLVVDRKSLAKELEQVEANLESAPDDKKLQPLAKKLISANQDLGRLTKELEILEEKEQKLTYALEQNGYARQRIYDQINGQESSDNRVRLAARTQRVLKQYQAKLAQRKVDLVGETLTTRFNQLCRKQDFIEKAILDPETYAITLYRSGYAFPREQLSAGERQLLAIATLWALRDISGRPMPVIVDTPLSRLDSEHRLSMTQDFFPHVSHQVIVLATDAEVDEELLGHLAPAVSHVFGMHYDESTGTTEHRRESHRSSGSNIELVDNADIPEPQLKLVTA